MSILKKKVFFGINNYFQTYKKENVALYLNFKTEKCFFRLFTLANQAVAKANETFQTCSSSKARKLNLKRL